MGANVDVYAAVGAGQALHLERAGITKQRVLEEYRRIAFLDPRGFWNADGSLKAITALDAEHAAALASCHKLLFQRPASTTLSDRRVFERSYK